MSRTVPIQEGRLRAAEAIVKLINEQPGTPSVAAVDAILTKADRKESFSTISGIAAELPRLYDVREAMAEGDAYETELEDAQPQVPTAPRPKFHAFETLRDRADLQIKALECLALLMEPQSADDALSVLLLVDSAFNEFAGEAYSEQALKGEAEAMWDNIGRALRALVRWLHRNGAASPLMKAHFHEQWLTPPSEAEAEALAAWRELVKRNEANR
jgi:hypothetical protein